MYSLEISFRVAPEKRHEFLQTARSLLATERAVQQRLKATFFERLSSPEGFFWRERFETISDLEERLRASSLQALLGAIGVLGRLEAVQVLEMKPLPRIFQTELPPWTVLSSEPEKPS